MYLIFGMYNTKTPPHLTLAIPAKNTESMSYSPATFIV